VCVCVCVRVCMHACVCVYVWVTHLYKSEQVSTAKQSPPQFYTRNTHTHIIYYIKQLHLNLSTQLSISVTLYSKNNAFMAFIMPAYKMVKYKINQINWWHKNNKNWPSCINISIIKKWNNRYIIRKIALTIVHSFNQRLGCETFSGRWTFFVRRSIVNSYELW